MYPLYEVDFEVIIKYLVLKVDGGAEGRGYGGSPHRR
jgi:hypothetical protein